jgi:regulatory protein
MAKITAITRQKKDSLRASIFVDGEFVVGVNEQTIEEFRLRKGDDWTEELVQKLTPFDDWITAKREAYSFVNRRARNQKQVRDKLRKLDIPPDIIERVIDHLVSFSLLDDARWADAFIADRLRRTAISQSQLRRELIAKGIPKDLATTATEKLEEETSELDLAIKAAAKKWRVLKNRKEEPRKLQQRLFQFLRMRGFSNGVIKETLKQVTAEEVIFEEY